MKEELSRVRVFLAGSGPLESSLKSFVERHDMAGRVTFLGYRSDVPDLLAAADLVVMPSRAESLGTSAVDAMLAQCPLITSTAGGLPEVVGGRPGDPAVATLVPPASPQQLADAIRRTLLTLPDARIRGRRARQRALREYTANTMINENLRIYEQCLQTRLVNRRAA